MDDTRTERLKKLGLKIKNIRLAKGWSQTELAYRINKDQQSIQRLEKGNVNPTYIYLLDLADGLEINIIELLDI